MLDLGDSVCLAYSGEILVEVQFRRCDDVEGMVAKLRALLLGR